jgi:ABC-type lipoprotein release transport system permease subunit
MITLIKMAYRDLGRNRRRSLFSALALAIGLALLLLMASVVTGEMRGSMDSSIKLQTGHLQVQALTYDDVKTSLAWQDLLQDPDQLTVAVATPRLVASGIIASGNETVGVRIVGIDPASPANTPFRDGMLSGEFLQADDTQGILIGQSLADKMHLQTGDQVNLLANTSNGDVDQQSFTIRGVYTTHTPGYDQGTVFMPLAKAQAITQTQNHASIIFVLLKNIDDTSAVVKALTTSQYQIKTWQQMNSLVLEFEQFAQAYMVVLYLIILGITATVIVNTLVMSVFERTREIGILSAIGMQSSRIMAMFFAESSMLAVGGIAMGLVLGGLMVAYATHYGFYVGNLGVTGIAFGDRIYAYLTPGDAITLTIVAFVITLLAALYPALLAARMEPVEALRGGKK